MLLRAQSEREATVGARHSLARHSSERRLLLRGQRGGGKGDGDEAHDPEVSDLLELDAGEFVEANVFQTRGAPLNAQPTRTFLAMAWVGPSPGSPLQLRPVDAWPAPRGKSGVSLAAEVAASVNGSACPSRRSSTRYARGPAARSRLMRGSADPRGRRASRRARLLTTHGAGRVAVASCDPRRRFAVAETLRGWFPARTRARRSIARSV